MDAYQTELNSQNTMLNKLDDTVKELKKVATDINQELDKHDVVIIDLEKESDGLSENIKDKTNDVSDLIEKKYGCSGWLPSIIIFLVCVLVIIIVLALI